MRIPTSYALITTVPEPVRLQRRALTRVESSLDLDDGGFLARPCAGVARGA